MFYYLGLTRCSWASLIVLSVLVHKRRSLFIVADRLSDGPDEPLPGSHALGNGLPLVRLDLLPANRMC